MNLGKLVKTVIKLAPIIYPIARKVISKNKETDGTSLKK